MTESIELRSPELYTSDPSVEFRREEVAHEHDEFEGFASIRGMVSPGITDQSRGVVLMNSPHGWRLPYISVQADESRTDTCLDFCNNILSGEATITAVHRITELEHRNKSNGDSSITHDFVVEASPLDDSSIVSDPVIEPWGELELKWFKSVPENVYGEHDDVVEDIRRFI